MVSYLKDGLTSTSPVKWLRHETHFTHLFSSETFVKGGRLRKCVLDTDILDFNVTKAKERRGRNKGVVMKKRLVTATEKRSL